MVTQTVAPEGATISLPSNFELHGVTNRLNSKEPSTDPPPPLGVLDNFQGTFAGNGFNMIFRPQSSATPTKFPNNPLKGEPDNVLELNLTTETLSFAKALGKVPNRGLFEQEDITLNGIPYVQTIEDVTNPDTGKDDNPPVNIHFEPGLWMRVPVSKINPKQVDSLNRMASIPHGTTINAQGNTPTTPTSGPPDIPVASITPFIINTNPPKLVEKFPSQTASLKNTLRLPQDLTLFMKEGTITQAILDDPNTVLRNANVGKSINHTTTFNVSTGPTAPQLGGGTANIDFLMGGKTGKPSGPNAHAAQMVATFWISEVSHKITVPAHTPGSQPWVIPAVDGQADSQVPSFTVDPQVRISAPKTITVTSTQIQYSQMVLLDFAGLSWPHISVATLVPKDPIKIPSTAFS